MAQPGSKISQGLSYREQSGRAYMATGAFNTGTGALYTYSTSLNGQFQTVGTLVFNTNANAQNAKAGRILQANGKMLIPNVHPGGGASGINPSTGAATGTPNPLPFPMIGVYDPLTGLNGYINPNDNGWAEYRSALPGFYNDGLSNADLELAGQGAEPRFGRAVSVNTSGTLLAGSADITAGRTGILTVAAATTPSVIAVTATEVTANSIILLTLQAASATTLRITAQAAGSFTITASANLAAGDKIHYLIIN